MRLFFQCKLDIICLVVCINLPSETIQKVQQIIFQSYYLHIKLGHIFSIKINDKISTI